MIEQALRPLRRVAMWVIIHVYVGRFAPRLFAFAIGAKEWERKDTE